jgi:hypothetical protein
MHFIESIFIIFFFFLFVFIRNIIAMQLLLKKKHNRLPKDSKERDYKY